MSKRSEPEEPPIRFKDSRKIDPDTGQLRADAGGGSAAPTSGAAAPSGAAATDAGAPADASAGAAGSPAAAGTASVGSPDENAQLLEERTRDLQRVSAEYANYRKRADRERLAAGELSVGHTLQELLPVLDDIDRAKAHGDLTGGLKAVADKLTAAFDKLGLVGFGEVGDTFDPAMHEAVMHEESDTVEVPTCSTVMRVGYRHGERLLRAAMVGVTDPTHPAAPVADPTTPEGERVDAPDDAGLDDATATDEHVASPGDATES